VQPEPIGPSHTCASMMVSQGSGKLPKAIAKGSSLGGESLEFGHRAGFVPWILLFLAGGRRHGGYCRNSFEKRQESGAHQLALAPCSGPAEGHLAPPSLASFAAATTIPRRRPR
jgi:hypothetical protein